MRRRRTLPPLVSLVMLVLKPLREELQLCAYFGKLPADRFVSCFDIGCCFRCDIFDRVGPA